MGTEPSNEKQSQLDKFLKFTVSAKKPVIYVNPEDHVFDSIVCKDVKIKIPAGICVRESTSCPAGEIICVDEAKFEIDWTKEEPPL